MRQRVKTERNRESHRDMGIESKQYKNKNSGLFIILSDNCPAAYHGDSKMRQRQMCGIQVKRKKEI